MATHSFAATVAEWAHEVQGAAEAIWKASAQALVEEAQRPVGQGGHMRVDTGFLRASLMASTSAMPSIDPGARPVKDQKYEADFGTIEAVIAAADLGETIYLGYTASYAGYREYGANGQPPDAFVRLAAQRWPQIVQAESDKLKGRLGA